MMETTKVDISNMRREAVLAALFNGTAPCGFGYFATQPSEYTREQAREDLMQKIKLNKSLYIDYLYGKRMKLSFGQDIVDVCRYNASSYENGQAIIKELAKDPSAFFASEAEMHADPIWRFCHRKMYFGFLC